MSRIYPKNVDKTGIIHSLVHIVVNEQAFLKSRWVKQPMQVFLRSLMVAGLDFVTVLNKIFYTTSRRNSLNYTSMVELEINL